MRFVEIHGIRILPPQAANRDEDGRPKSLRYGGVERVRLSSQAQKRALRQAFRELALLPEEERAWRTRKLLDLLGRRLPEMDQGMLAQAFAGLVRAMGAAVGEENTLQYLWFVSEEEVARMADLLQRHAPVLAAYVPEGEEGGKKPKKRAVKNELPEEVAEAVRSLLSAPSVEVALFGRMLSDTALAYAEVDGALSVAHAIGVGRDFFESDYFTAVDDVEGGAGHLQHGDFAAGTIYQYLVLDLEALVRTVGRERALLGAEALLRAFPLALPGGKRRAFAHYGEPEAVLLRVGEGSPRNGAKLFEDPVSGPKAPEKAFRRLAEGLARFAEIYGEAEGEWRGAVALFSLDGLPLEAQPTYPALVKAALARAEALLEG